MSLLSRFFSLFLPAPPPDAATQAGLERVAGLIDTALAVAPDAAARLAAPFAHAREFCAKLVDTLPPPREISRQSFAADPLVHALFASADDIGNLIAASRPVRDWLNEPCAWQGDSFIALMAARRAEKKVLGVALRGDIVASDVPQSLLQFSNQALVLPAADPAAAREVLLEKAFDSLLLTFAGHLERAREAYKTLRNEREMARIQLRSKPSAAFPERHIAALDEHLSQQFQSLQPDKTLGELAGFLMQPEEALSLHPVRLWVTRSGVIQEESAHDPDAAQIDFWELTSRDRRRHLVLPVQISCTEAREALSRAEQARATHEYMLLL